MQALKRLGTTASLMMIVAHPDDEDGALLTYLSRGHGRALHAIYAEPRRRRPKRHVGREYDALGLIRTNELLKADEYYGAKQLWGTEADFGFSKTQEESFAQWGHERVLYDAVLAVRRGAARRLLCPRLSAASPTVTASTRFRAKLRRRPSKRPADPNVFPEQLRTGLQPWQPLAVYSHGSVCARY